MAAPADKNTKNLNGKWSMNKSQSDSIEPVLALQGIGWVIRKALGAASITLDVNQYDAPPKPPNTATDVVTHIDIAQAVSGGLTGTQENRCLDDCWREHSDWLFGSVKGRSTWVGVADLDDEFLKKDWEATVGVEKPLILSHVESQDSGWVARQVWGFQTVNGERKYVRQLVLVKGDKRVQVRFVYDFIS